jgi:hypothetical protein
MSSDMNAGTSKSSTLGFQDVADSNKEILVRRMFEGAIAAYESSSDVVDRYSTWLLVGTGAALTLAIANLDDLSVILTNLGTKGGLFAILLSLVAGLIQKTLAFRCQSEALVGKAASECFLSEKKAYSESQEALSNKANAVGQRVDIQFAAEEAVLDKLCECLPFHLRWWVQGVRMKIRRNPAFAYKRRLRLVVAQGHLLYVQVLLVLVGLGILLFSFNPPPVTPSP